MDVKTLYNRALKHSKTGKYEKALEDFNQVIHRQPKNADAYGDRGVAKYHLDDRTGAMEDLNKAVELEPENPYRYASRAYIRDRYGDTKGGIEDYRKALDLEPENAISQNNLGLLEEKLGYMDRAKKRFQIADRLSEDLHESDFISMQERDKAIESLLQELDIQVSQEEKASRSLIGQMLTVFTSSKERNDFFVFLKKFFRKSK